MKSIGCIAMSVVLLIGAAPCLADGVSVQRSGSENPMHEVAKSVVYGGLAGLMLGSAVALVDDGGNDGDQIKWGFAAGTFFGFAFGLYHVMHRPSAGALIEIEDGKVRLAAAPPALDRRSGVRLALVRAKF